MPLRSTFGTAVLGGLSALAMTTYAHAQAEPQYGTRSVRACPAPVLSRPDNEQVKALIRCDREGKLPDRITLIEDIQVQTGGMRAYNAFADGHRSGIDPSAGVMPIRGSLTSYQCSKLAKFGSYRGTYYIDDTGKNCLIVHENKAEGACYTTTFGDWNCDLKEAVDPSAFLHDQPPPSSAD